MSYSAETSELVIVVSVFSWCSLASILSQRSSRLLCITTEFLFQSTSETTVKRVSLLSDMHLRNIRTKLLLMSRNHEATKHLEVGPQTAAVLNTNPIFSSGKEWKRVPSNKRRASPNLVFCLRRAPGSWCRLSRKSLWWDRIWWAWPSAAMAATSSRPGRWPASPPSSWTRKLEPLRFTDRWGVSWRERSGKELQKWNHVDVYCFYCRSLLLWPFCDASVFSDVSVNVPLLSALRMCYMCVCVCVSDGRGSEKGSELPGVCGGLCPGSQESCW